MKQHVTEVVRKALKDCSTHWGLTALPEVEVEIPKSTSFGDVATTIAMDLTKTLKKPPRKIAEELLPEILKQQGPFEKIEIAGPGFINFTFKKEYFYENLERILREEHVFLRTDFGKGKKIQIEFVSANPTGPLHIGHGRGAAVGNALSNLLEAAGFQVLREYYINDAGLQVELLGQSVYARYQQILGNAVPFPEQGYRGDYIEDISKEIIKKANKKYLHQPLEKCRDFFANYAYKMMLADIAKDLKDFGIRFDRWQSEKELYKDNKIKKALNALHDKDERFLYEKDGASWSSTSLFGDDKDRVVIKKDGEYTYFASDIAYHKDKLDRGFDMLINIWGADHHGYIQRVRSVLEAFGLEKEKFRVILVQMVALFRKGKPVQMSKRAGEFITLREVIDEVGADTAKFMFLTRRPDSHLEFDLAVVKEQSAENPVFYVQYAFARISSIFRQAAEKGILGSGSGVQDVDLALLKKEEEIFLIKKLLQYGLVFEGAAQSCEPHRITYYLQELAKMFHAYYNRHRVISDDSNLTSARLCLCKAIHIVLEDGLKILGVSVPERM